MGLISQGLLNDGLESIPLSLSLLAAVDSVFKESIESPTYIHSSIHPSIYQKSRCNQNGREKKGVTYCKKCNVGGGGGGGRREERSNP